MEFAELSEFDPRMIGGVVEIQITKIDDTEPVVSRAAGILQAYSITDKFITFRVQGDQPVSFNPKRHHIKIFAEMR